MDLLLLKLVAILRPLASVRYAEAIFDWLGIGLFGLLIGALLMRGAVHRSMRISTIDLFIVAFTVWCLTIYLVYFEAAQIRYVSKIVIPLLAYIAVKNVVHDIKAYRQLLVWAIVAFSIPVLLSVALILTGGGVDRVNYWTGVARYEGAYVESHSFGHSMTLLLMLIAMYVTLRSSDEGAANRYRLQNVALGGLALLALYCLYMSQVRSAILGLLVFATVYLFFFNRRLLFLGIAGLAAVATLTVPFWLPALVPEIAGKSATNEVNVMELGSGRPTYWLHDFLLYLDLPIDQKLAGVGIGTGDPSADSVVEYKLYGHNDWLDILTQTGAVGLLLFAGLQIAIYKAIRRLPANHRHLFLALFFAVIVMMFVSNSYAWRIQVSQLYFMVLAFIEIYPRAETAEERTPVSTVARTA